ncbi:TPA: hypothetical protein JW546_005021, partial [Escherichia coli]|nr:hypothetical protein [Escherichia coli]
MLVSSGVMAEEFSLPDGNKLVVNGNIAHIVNSTGDTVLSGINPSMGSIMTWNQIDADNVELMAQELEKTQGIPVQMSVQAGMEAIMYPVDNPNLKLEKLKTLTAAEINEIKEQQKKVSDVVTVSNKDAYVEAVRSGGNSDAAIAAAKDGPGVLQEYNRIVTNIDQLNKDTTFAMDADGNITLDETAGTGERYGVKDVVAEVVEDTTVRVAEDGSLTTARNTQTTKRVNEAVVDLDKSVRTNSQDIATNRKAIQSNSRQLQEHNARLNDHQRQIRENHEEMKRAAAQSAALAGLFQPYSVGKFNATAALGGYSDKQAVAVGVGYRF